MNAHPNLISFITIIRNEILFFVTFLNNLEMIQHNFFPPTGFSYSINLSIIYNLEEYRFKKIIFYKYLLIIFHIFNMRKTGF